MGPGEFWHPPQAGSVGAFSRQDQTPQLQAAPTDTTSATTLPLLQGDIDEPPHKRRRINQNDASTQSNNNQGKINDKIQHQENSQEDNELANRQKRIIKSEALRTDF